MVSRVAACLSALPCALPCALLVGCTTFGATLPPGAANGSFLDEARGTVPLTGAARHRQVALDDAERDHIEANIDVFRALREDARTLRADLHKGAADLAADDGRDSINRSDLRRVRDLAQRYLELDALLYALWTTYRDHLPYRSEPDPYAPMRAATLLTPATREVGGLLALAAELERLDTARVVVQTLRPYHALTRFLNRGDPALELAPESFDRCIGALYDPDRRALVARQLHAWQQDRERILARAAQEERLAALLETVQRSPSARALLAETNGERRLDYLWMVVERSALNAAGPLFDMVIAAGFIEVKDDDMPPIAASDGAALTPQQTKPPSAPSSSTSGATPAPGAEADAPADEGATSEDAPAGEASL